MTQRDTLSHNISTIEKHLEECRNCQEELHISPSVRDRIDAYALGSHELSETDVHRTVYYGLTPLWEDQDLERASVQRRPHKLGWDNIAQQ
jgi:hypothetical protein